MTTTNEKLRNVAEVAARIIMGQTEEKEPQVISEELKGDQHKIDANKNNKIDAHDFKLLRSKKKVEEEAERIDELSKNTLRSYLKGSKAEAGSQLRGDVSDKAASLGRTQQDKDDSRYEGGKLAKRKLGAPGSIPAKVMAKEEAERIDEAEIVKTATGMRVYGSSYGDSAKARRDQVKKSIDTAKGPKMKDLSDIEAEKKKKKKMSEMVATYQEQGLKGLFASLVKEEPTSAEFDSEIKMAQDKSQGKGKKAEVSKAAVQAVQSEEFEVVMDELNGYAEVTIEERSMTEPEMKKKEEIVKSMKKGIAGFKDRYGDRAKNVMYATATKQAMKD